MVEKIKVPSHVADALKPYSKIENKGDAFIDIKSLGNTTEQTAILLKHLKDNDILSALINGYEIERTPEEKLREYYYEQLEQELNPRNITEVRQHRAGVVYGIEKTLNILGIKVEGING